MQRKAGGKGDKYFLSVVCSRCRTISTFDLKSGRAHDPRVKCPGCGVQLVKTRRPSADKVDWVAMVRDLTHSAGSRRVARQSKKSAARKKVSRPKK